MRLIFTMFSLILNMWGGQMEIIVGKTLAGLRRMKKFMQKDVAAKLADYGIDVSAKTIYNWEKGVAQPNARQFLALCDILEVDDVLWQFAGVRRGPYAGLNRAGRQKARELTDLLFLIDMYRDEPAKPAEPAEPAERAEQVEATGPRLLKLYDIPASAGQGNFLGDSDYELIEAPGYVQSNVDFALRVGGDSMEPLLQDGQIIWIREQETLSSGEIGVFIYYGEVYCKMLILEDGAAYLRSLNPRYEDIEILDGFGFRAVGKVV